MLSGINDKNAIFLSFINDKKIGLVQQQYMLFNNFAKRIAIRTSA